MKYNNRTHYPALRDADWEILRHPDRPTIREIALRNIERKRLNLPPVFPPGWRIAVEVKDVLPEELPAHEKSCVEDHRQKAM